MRHEGGGGGGGGGKKTRMRPHHPVDLEERIANLLLKYKKGLKENKNNKDFKRGT